MTRARGFLLAFQITVGLGAGASSLAAGDAFAFCRTTTCALPADFSPSGTTCEPAGWAAECKAEGKLDIPLWWANACVSYDVQAGASKSVTFAEADAAWTAAFTTWSSATCPATASGDAAPSIKAVDLGAVSCGTVGYVEDAANQHVLVFRDDGWPYESAAEMEAGAKSLTVALTTVNFDKDTGEIYDADIEINSSQYQVIPTTTPGFPGSGDDVFDLQTVLTHESGHFLGLAHSSDATAVMFADDEGTDIKKRALADDDVAAICSVYPPDGTRSVATTVTASGSITAGKCDATPRGGFSSACASPAASGGCATSPRPAGSTSGVGAAAGAMVAVALIVVAGRGRVRRRRRARPRARVRR